MEVLLKSKSGELELPPLILTVNEAIRKFKGIHQVDPLTLHIPLKHTEFFLDSFQKLLVITRVDDRKVDNITRYQKCKIIWTKDDFGYVMGRDIEKEVGVMFKIGQ